MLWIKEVEMVESVDDEESSHSIQGYTHFPNFEMLDARIASDLKKIIQNSYFKKRKVKKSKYYTSNAAGIRCKTCEKWLQVKSWMITTA